MHEGDLASSCLKSKIMILFKVSKTMESLLLVWTPKMTKESREKKKKRERKKKTKKKRKEKTSDAT